MLRYLLQFFNLAEHYITNGGKIVASTVHSVE